MSARMDGRMDRLSTGRRAIEVPSVPPQAFNPWREPSSRVSGEILSTRSVRRRATRDLEHPQGANNNQALDEGGGF